MVSKRPSIGSSVKNKKELGSPSQIFGPKTWEGWQPKYSLEKGLKETTNWFTRQNLKKFRRV